MHGLEKSGKKILDGQLPRPLSDFTQKQCFIPQNPRRHQTDCLYPSLLKMGSDWLRLLLS